MSRVTRHPALAALSMCVWMGCWTIFLALAFLDAAPGKITLPTVLMTAALNAVLLASVGWASVGVLRGERLRVAEYLLIFYGVAPLTFAAIYLAMGGVYRGSPLLFAWSVVLFATWLASLVMVLRARRPPDNA